MKKLQEIKDRDSFIHSGIAVCYTSHERRYFSLSTDIWNSLNTYEIEDLHTTNIVLSSLKSRVPVGSLNNNVSNTFVKFQVWVVQRDINI